MLKSGQNIRIFLLCCSFSLVMAYGADENKARYDYYRLVRLQLETEDHIELFKQLEIESDSYTFYGHSLKAPQDLTILVAAHK